MTAGFCAGLVFLTKPDIFAALGITIIAAFFLFWRKHGQTQLLKPLGMFALAAVIPSLFFFFYFLRAESPHDSLRSVIFGWLPLLHGTVTKSPFYIWCTGLDKPGAHLKEIFIYFGAVVLALAVYAFVFKGMEKLKWLKLRFTALIVVISPLLIWAGTFKFWFQCGWPLPLLCLSACVLVAWNYKKLEQPAFPMLWSLFGLLLLAKLGLFPRIWHYGFALAMPAFASSVYLLFWLLPKLLEKKFGVPSLPFRVMVGLVLLLGIGNLFEMSQAIYDQKSLALGNGGDTIMTYNLNSDQSKAIYAAMEWTEKYVSPGATLAVLPQGIMLNYLTRHANSMPGMDWNPTMFTVFGQTKMTDAFEKNPPDYVFIVEWDSSDFGVRYFGSTPDYGQELMQWIGTNYQQQLLIGNEPLKDGQFGIKILKRLPTVPAQSGGFNSSKSAMSFSDKKFIPTSNDASVQPKPSGAM
jgi:hypothetical protein